MAEHPNVLIVGAGIIGASIAWHLCRAGARVTVIESGAPGGIATRRSWAWINASRGNPEPYFRLRMRAMAEWRRLEQELPELRVSWSGGLIWDMAAAELDAYAAEHDAWGYGIRRVGRAEITRIEPALAEPPDRALHVAEEGSVEPLAAAETLLRAAQALGAAVITDRPVRGLDFRAGRVVGVVTEVGRCQADEVILAAGVATPGLAATAGFTLPLTAPPGLLVTTKPHARLLKGLVMAPALHLRQTAEGRFIAGADFGGGDPGEDVARAADEVFQGIRSMVRGGGELIFDFHSLGHRPMPVDGFPAVGPVPGIAGLYVAVMHSGITLAPAVGRFVTEEILAGRRDSLLAPYGLERFPQRVVRAHVQ
jgi:glycine/D-amino acid oxidase-like deaminating enzyme